MSKKRKRGAEGEAATSAAPTADTTASKDEAEKTDGEFSGFSDDDGAELDDEVDEDDDESEEADLAGGVSLETPDVDDASEDDEDVEADIAAISAALSKAKKRQRKA
jgi:nuclear GTP-binding protein